MNHVKHVIPMSDSSVSIKPEDIQPTVLRCGWSRCPFALSSPSLRHR